MILGGFIPFVRVILWVRYTEMPSLPSDFERQSFKIPPRRISEGQWGENRLKAERAWFLIDEVRRAEPETELLLTRWGKSCVFSESTVLSELRHTRRPISSASLDRQLGKAKSSKSLLPFPCISLTQCGREIFGFTGFSLRHF